MLVNKNILLMTDVYKLGHMTQYPEGTTKIMAYLCARSGKVIPFTLFFGLQYYLNILKTPVTRAMADEFYEYYEMIMGGKTPESVSSKIEGLVKLGYIPLEVKAVKEGTVMPVQNALMTVTNTHPDFAWCVGFFESLMLKVWNTTTVASYSMKLHNLVADMAEATCTNKDHMPWAVHDFGYRGCSSEETAALSGAAHLLNFRGTDTVVAVKLLKDVYSGSGLIGASVPASEHSVMCAFGKDHELDAFKNMLKINPSGIVSIVSDTYNLWNVMTNFANQLKPEILGRDGKVVFRPDSGDPKLILCGDPSAKEGSPEYKGVIRLLDETFGSTINDKGYRVLNPKVGVIYGDAMYFERYQDILYTLADMGYASSNLVIGVGGLLLQQHSRDEQGFAIKATYCVVNGEEREIVKDPITDSKKKSLKGLICLEKIDGKYVTRDQVSKEEEKGGLLETVFLNGKITRVQTLEEIRSIAYGS